MPIDLPMIMKDWEDHNPKPRREDFPPGWRGSLAWITALAGWQFNLWQFGGSALERERYLTGELREYDNEAVGYFSRLFSLFGDPTSTEGDLSAALADAMNATGPWASSYRAFFNALAFTVGITGYITPASRAFGYAAEGKWRTGRPTPVEMLGLDWRGVITPSRLEGWKADIGIPPEYYEGLEKLLTKRLSDGDWGLALQRGMIEEGEFFAELTKRGWDLADQHRFRDLLHRIPGPADLVRMAVREAWDEETARKWRYDERFSGDFAAWMAKQGLGGDWAKWYWRSHWILPSVSLGYSMLHRDVIDEAELKHLMSISDIAPGWIDRLIKVAYAPYSRIDLRRMYDLGILDEAGVYRANLDLGYDPEHAAGLTAFTIALYAEAERAASRTDIITAYEVGQLGRKEAKDYLLGLGISDLFAEVYLKKADYKVAERLEKETLSYLKVLFVNNEITETALRSEFGALNLPETQVVKLLTEWRVARRAKVEIPSLSKLEEFVKHDVIDLPTFEAEVIKHGYKEEYALWYRNNLVFELAEAAKAEAERAQKEQDRLAISEFRTDRRLLIQAIDVEIAEQNAIVTDGYVALSLLLDPVRKETATLAIAEGNREVARQRTSIAKLEAARDDAHRTLKRYIVDEERIRLEAIIGDALLEIRELQVKIAGDVENIAWIRAASTVELLNLKLISRATWDFIVERTPDEIEAEGIPYTDLVAWLKVTTWGDLLDAGWTTPTDAIAEIEKWIAERDTKIAVARTVQTEAQLELRGYVPDEDRIRLETIIGTAEADIDKAQIAIREAQETIAENRILLLTEPTDEDRIEIEGRINAARIRIAALKIERAKVPLIP